MVYDYKKQGFVQHDKEYYFKNRKIDYSTIIKEE
jgi:hypothetical protein